MNHNIMYYVTSVQTLINTAESLYNMVYSMLMLTQILHETH